MATANFKSLLGPLQSSSIKPSQVFALVALTAVIGLIVLMPYTSFYKDEAMDGRNGHGLPGVIDVNRPIMNEASGPSSSSTPATATSTSSASQELLYSTCPNMSLPIYPYTLSEFESINQETSYKCFQIPVSHPDFTISHCQHQRACGVGRFEIGRKDKLYCSNVMKMNLSTYQEQDDYFHQDIGPVEYWLGHCCRSVTYSDTRSCRTHSTYLRLGHRFMFP